MIRTKILQTSRNMIRTKILQTTRNMIRTKILQTTRNMIYGLQKIPCINKQMTDRRVKMQSDRMKILKCRPKFHFC